jgi:phosphoribosyl-ATP pyrophosphohydrolase/phosphoribosyl-AMP cyclohydrolase
MLGYLNEEALALTISSGFVHFWSRSRQELWKKGETSGNTLATSSVEVDCDSDALLIKATASGPTCHTGEANCFATDASQFGFLDTLWDVIDDKATHRPAGSYTAQLIESGPDLTARKLVEEATEVLISAKNHVAGTDDDQRLSEELGDVFFHLLVTMRERGIEPAGVMDELRNRQQ